MKTENLIFPYLNHFHNLWFYIFMNFIMIQKQTKPLQIGLRNVRIFSEMMSLISQVMWKAVVTVVRNGWKWKGFIHQRTISNFIFDKTVLILSELFGKKFSELCRCYRIDSFFLTSRFFCHFEGLLQMSVIFVWSSRNLSNWCLLLNLQNANDKTNE